MCMNPVFMLGAVGRGGIGSTPSRETVTSNHASTRSLVGEGQDRYEPKRFYSTGSQEGTQRIKWALCPSLPRAFIHRRWVRVGRLSFLLFVYYYYYTGDVRGEVGDSTEINKICKIQTEIDLPNGIIGVQDSLKSSLYCQLNRRTN